MTGFSKNIQVFLGVQDSESPEEQHKHSTPLGKRVGLFPSASPANIKLMEEPDGSRRDRGEGATNGDLRWHCNIFVFVS